VSTKGKNFKIWGIGYGLLGDIIMQLPLLTYFEKKYPDSYKILVVEKKCSFCAPIFFNHPLIDRIKITDEWGLPGENDKNIALNCDIRDLAWKNPCLCRYPPFGGKWYDLPFWWNTRSCIESAAITYGVSDLMEVLTEEERKPKLVRWFDSGTIRHGQSTYSKKCNADLSIHRGSISVWPFATAGSSSNRNPGVYWWGRLLDVVFDLGYTVYHCGRPSEPCLSDHEKYIRLNNSSYMEQIAVCLETDLSIGTDSGAMWVVGAYSHPAIHLMSYWLNGHSKNPLALEPVNDNGVTIFHPGGCSQIDIMEVVRNIDEIAKNKKK
jgi:ADP-heptose:LPS heptosyltransferase